MTVDVPDFMPESQQFLNLYLGVTTQIAALIATGNPAGNPGGVPLLALNNLLDKQLGKTIPHGTNYTSPNLPINQPAYDFALQVTYPAGTTNAFLMVQFVWTDSAIGTGFLTTETWFMVGGSQGLIQYSGRGLTKGDTLQVIITNLDTAQTATITYGITQHSRVLPRDDIRTTIFNNPGAAFTAAPSDLPSSVIAMAQAVSLAANSSFTWYLPLFAGLAQLLVPEQVASRVILNAPAALIDPNATIVQNVLLDTGAIAANAGFNAMVVLPRQVCTLRLFNASAAAATVSATVIAQEY